MTSARTKFGLRPMLPEDASVLADIYRVSIEELTGDDYNPMQQDAWASAADDEEAFAARLAQRLTLLATLDGETVGFAALKEPDHIDLLYVHPVAAGQGVATTLCDALEKLAAARNAARLTVDASDTALPFFEKRGYVAKQRNTVACAGEWLANTTMEKQLTPKGVT